MTENYEGGKPRKPYKEAFTIVKRLLQFLTPHKSEILVITILIIIVSAIPLVPPRLVGVIFDKVILNQDLDVIERTKLLSLLIGIILLAGICLLYFSYLKDFKAQRLSEKLVLEMRSRLFSHLHKLSLAFYDKKRIGALVSRIIDDSKTLEQMFREGLSALLIAPISFVGIFFIMLLLNWKLTLLALIPIPFLYITMVIFIKRMRGLGRQVKDKNEYLVSYLNENISNIRITQLYNKSDYEKERFNRVSYELYELKITLTKLVTRYFPLMGFITSSGLLLILLFGGLYSVYEGLSGGELISFIAYLAYIYSPLTSMTMANYILQNIALSGERIFEILDKKPQIQDGFLELKAHKLDIVFDNVSFAYEGERNVIDRVSFKIDYGEKIGITGQTGAGKTTIAKLIVRFYDVKEGSITTGGIDIKDLKLSSLRESICMVLQDDILFCDTIKNNLRYGKLDATDEEIKYATQIAEIDMFISQLPSGYDTVVGERGFSLSAGERQRLCIAKALLRQSKILILDEATSSLDIETEQKILDKIFKIMAEDTLIIISHRSSALQRCERVIEIKLGKA